MSHIPLWALAAAGVLSSSSVLAQDDLKALREEVARLKQAYERRIEALEKRLAQAEAAAGQAANPTARAGDGKAGTFNPEIGLVLQGRYKRMQDVPERAISGYWPAGDEHGGDRRGLSLEHSELMFAANIDPNFRGVARFAIDGEGRVEVEEASVATLGLGSGFTVRAGRFASDIGYENARHPHEWDFADATLMQKVLFGGEGYRHDGVQVKWLAPTPFLLQFGAEFGRGANFPGTDRNKNGSGAGALFVKAGGDLGASHAWQAGLSFLSTRAADREAHFEDTDAGGPNEVLGLFSGKSRTAIADFVWKWAPEGNPSRRNLKLQAELFRRTESGMLDCTADVASSPCNGRVSLGDLRTRQSGGYLAAVYQFMPKWRVGYRYDWLGKGNKSFDDATVFAALAPANHYFADFKPKKDSLMLDWSSSEFSRLRLQFARDRSLQGVSDNQWTLQYIMSLGAHGAHKF